MITERLFKIIWYRKMPFDKLLIFILLIKFDKTLLMNFNKLLFSDIMQDKILYYDKDVEEACFDICNTLKIDFLPDYDSKHYYELIENSFVKKVISDDIKLKINDKVFDENHIEKFKNNKHNVLFVYSGNVLKGIVHYADYNKNIVLTQIQKDVLHFEKILRELLILNNKSNEDLLKFFKSRLEDPKYIKFIDFYKRKIDEYQKNIYKMNNVGAFQIFYLSDLINYLNSSDSGCNLTFGKYKSTDSTSAILSLRNMVMHGKNPIEIDSDTSIYSIDSLLLLKNSVEILEHYNSIVEEEINMHKDYALTRKLENINKLNIIHEHHPNSLKYFLS